MSGRSWHASGQTVRVPVHEPEQIWLTGTDGISSAYQVFSDQDTWRNSYWKVYNTKTYQKIKAWEYENEYRLALANTFREFAEPESRNLCYDKKHLKGLIFGIKTSEYDKARIVRSLLAQERPLKDFAFYQAEYDDEKQSISVREKKMEIFLRNSFDKCDPANHEQTEQDGCQALSEAVESK